MAKQKVVRFICWTISSVSAFEKERKWFWIKLIWRTEKKSQEEELKKIWSCNDKKGWNMLSTEVRITWWNICYTTRVEGKQQEQEEMKFYDEKDKMMLKMQNEIQLWGYKKHSQSWSADSLKLTFHCC